MNRFTQFLRQWAGDEEELNALLDHADALEALVIRVYKGKAATPADEAEYGKIQRWLEEHYARWQDEMALYWREALVAGRPAREDPVLRLLRAGAAADFVGDWEAMQYLPAVREALNQMLLARSQKE